MVLISKETYLEHTVDFCLVVLLVLLVSQYEVENLLNHAQTGVENDVAKLWTPENAFLHVIEGYVLKAEDFLSVVVRDRSSLHPSNLHLHYILKKAASYEIIVLALKRTVLALKSDNLIVKVIDVVLNLVTDRGSSSSL